MSVRQQAQLFPGRHFYKGRGVDWVMFMPWLLLAFGVAFVLAEGMAQLYRVGHYYIFIVPLLAALGVAGMVNLATKNGHCRSAWTGGVVGFCAGFALYIGYFYLGMIHVGGAEAASHPEYLPSYINFRMHVESTRDTHDYRHDDDKPRRPDNLYMNWGRFVFEFGFVLLITTGAGMRRARKPYCNTCRRWMLREITPFEPGQSTELIEALRTQSARSLATVCAKSPHATIPNTSLAMDFCPSLKDGRTRDCPVYVSVKEITTVPQNASLDVFEQSKGKMLASKLALNADELPALAPRFPALGSVVGRSAVSALLPSEETDSAVADQNLTYAETTPLPEEYRGKALSRKTVIIGNVLSAMFLLGVFAGVGLLLWGLLLGFPDHPPAEGVSPQAKLIGTVLMILGGTSFLISLGVSLFDSSIFATRYLRKVVRNEIARRTATVVDVHDPDALLVEMVPKMNWGKMMLDDAADVGLMVIDQQRREIRFEGDKERWRIPAAAIVDCQLEVFIQRQGNTRTRRYFAVLRAHHHNGFWEAPIRERGKMGVFSGKRKKSTARMVQAIQQLRDVREQAAVKL